MLAERDKLLRAHRDEMQAQEVPAIEVTAEQRAELARRCRPRPVK